MDITIHKKVDALGRLPIPADVRTALFGPSGTGEVELDIVDGKLVATPIETHHCEKCGGLT